MKKRLLQDVFGIDLKSNNGDWLGSYSSYITSSCTNVINFDEGSNSYDVDYIPILNLIQNKMKILNTSIEYPIMSIINYIINQLLLREFAVIDYNIQDNNDSLIFNIYVNDSKSTLLITTNLNIKGV